MYDLADRIKAIECNYPEYIPVTVSFVPAVWMKYREEIENIVARHPVIFGNYAKGSRNFDEVHGTYTAGEHTDVWGCVWSNIYEGCEAIVTHHPVKERKDVHSLELPEKDSGLPHGFMYLRLADLRGFEEIMIDFAEEPPELQILIDKVLEYNLRQAKLHLEQNENEPIIYLGDDLGLQHSLPISPEKWRKYLKPCFAEIFKVFKEAGHYVYLHTDGHIYEIIPDLIECGADVINPQIRANGLENLATAGKGKVCYNLDLDRQMFPFCRPEEIDPHVEEVVKALGAPEGGLWIIAEIGPDYPLENVEAICVSLEKYRGYFK